MLGMRDSSRGLFLDGSLAWDSLQQLDLIFRFQGVGQAIRV